MTSALPRVILYPVLHEYEFILFGLKHALMHKASGFRC